MTPSPSQARMPLRLAAYQSLKEDILSCQLRPGDTVYEKDVADRLGTSKTPVREAIAVLTGEGFVEVYPRQGTIVRRAGVRDIRNVMLMRHLVEPEASAQAASRAVDSDIARLRVLDEEQLNGNLPSLDLEQHAQFHIAVAEIARIPQLTTVVRAMQDQMRWFLATHASDGGAPFPKHSHVPLVDAIERGCPDDARDIAEERISMARETLLRHLIGA